MTSIKVAIKVRPLIQRELNDGMAIEWSVNENTIHAKRGENAFQFDHIFDRTTTNAEVFDTVVKPVIDAAVNGFNGTVFAYGQTSSGKTFTMMGNDNDPGIIPQTVTQIFNAIDSTDREFLLRVAYIEIYNERVNDLLDKNNVDLKVREDNGEVFIKCKEEVIHMPENILTLMKRGDKNRRIGRTDMNEYSSRSHSIFRIIIESKATDSDTDGAVQVSQLNLVDLAGSERASATGATGERFHEGKYINLSLSALGKVIMNLSEKADHVGFRDSKLTRILQNSLGGNAMTAIICAVTPAALDETLNTLNFASRAKRIKNKPQLNEVMTDAALLKRYKKQIDTLSQKLQSVDGQNQSEEVKQMANKLEETEQMNRALQERINNLQKNIISGASKSDQETFKKKAKRRQTWAAPARHSMIPRFSMSNLPPIPEKFDLNTTAEEAVPMEDFEVELYQTQLQEEDDLIDLPTRIPKITFSDTNDVTYLSDKSFLSTPRRSSSPGTPKAVLREKLSHAIDELETLKEVTSLEKQLNAEDAQNDLRHEFKDLKNQMRILRHENANLEETLKMKEENIVHLKKLLEDAQRRTEKMNDNLMAGDSVMILNEISVLKETESTMRCSKECELEKQDLVDILKLTDNQVLEYKSQMAELEKKLAEMEQERSSFVKKQQEDEATVLKLQAKVQTMEAENFVLTEKMNQLGKMRKEKEELILKQREFEERNASFEEKLQSQTEEIEKLRKDNENLQKQMSESPREDLKVVEYEVAIELLKSEKDRLNEELKEKFEECENFQLRLNSSEEKLKDSETRINVLSQTMESLLSDNESLKTQLLEIETKLSRSEAKSVDLETENRELVNKLESLEEKLKLELEKEDLSEHVKELQKKNEELEVQLRELNSQIESMEQVENSNKQLTAVEEKMDEMRKNFEDNKREMEEQDRMNKEKINDLEMKLKDYLDEREKFLNQVRELEELSRGYEDKCRTLEMKVEEFKDQEKCSEVLQGKIEELEEILVDEKEKNKELQDKFEEEKNEKEQYSNQLEELVMKVQYYETKLDEVTKNQEGTSNVQEVLQGKIEELEEILVNEKKKNKELQEKFEEETSEKEQYSNQLEELIMKVQCYETKLEEELKNQEGTSNVQEKIEELEKNLTEEKGKTAELQEKFEKEKREKEQYSNDLEKLREQIQSYKTKIGDLLDQEKQITSQLEQARMERDAHLSHIDQIEKQCKECESNVQKLQDHIEQQAQLMSEEVLRLQKLLDGKEVELKQLRSQLEEQQKLLSTNPKSSTPMNSISRNRDSLEPVSETDLNKSQMIKVQPESSPMLRPMVDEILQKSSQSLNSTSIFNNDSYFDKLEVTQSEGYSDCMTDSMTDKSMLAMKNQIQDKNDIDIKNYITDMKESINGLQKMIIVLSSENDNLTETLNKTRIDFQTMETELQDTIRQLKEQNKILTDEKNGLELQLVTASQTIETIDELKTQLAIYETEINSMKTENEKPIEDNEIIASLESENNNLSEQLSRKIEEFETLKKSHVQISEQLQNLQPTPETNLGELRVENEYLKIKVFQLEEEVERLNNENDQLSSEIMDHIENSERLQNSEEKTRELAEKIRLLEVEVEQLTEDNKNLANYKEMKSEVKYLNKQLKEMQKKYEQNVAFTESLRTKAKESLDESLMNESFNVSMIEDKVEHADSEFDCLKDIHSLLSISFNKKCEEIERLQAYISSSLISSEAAEQISKKDKIEKLNGELGTLRSDLKVISDNYENFRTMLEKVREDMEIMKKENEKLKEQVNLAETKSTSLEEENVTLHETIESFQNQESKFHSEKSGLESMIEKLQTEKSNTEQHLISVMETAKEVENSLTDKLKTLQASKDDLSSQLAQSESIIQKHQENIAGLETTLKEATANLSQQIKENNELKNQLTKLEQDLSKTLAATENKSATTELRSGKEKIINEIKSLDPETKLSTETPLERLFAALLGSVMKKEAEFIKNMQNHIDAQEQKLKQLAFERSEDQKKSDDFIRTLEAENEKLLADLREVEKKKGRQMEKNLEQSTENSELIEKLKQERNAYNEQVQELTCKNQSISSKNKELLKSLEEFQNKEKQFKVTFEAKSNENLRLSHEISQLKIQLGEISEAYKNISSEAAEKDRRAEQITFLLKQEKDKSSEYKTKLESFMPEYQILQEQLKKLKNSIGEYKNKIVSLTESLNKKSAEFEGLKKSVDEQSETVKQSENERKRFKQRCNELESEIAKLTRKLRNSTPGQVTLDDLTDKNKMLQNNLEGASNRIVQLQKQNAQYVEEISELKKRIQSFEKDLSVSKSFSNLTCNGVSSEQISVLEQEVTKLTEKNKELDEENEELSEKIKELQHENGVLENKVLDFEEAAELNADSWELKKKLVDAQTEVNEYKSKTVQLEEKLRQAEVKLLSAEKILDTMNNRNTELQTKVASLEDRLESLSANSTRSNSPAFEMGLRHQRRSNQFNQNRNLTSSGTCECSINCADDPNCPCNHLRNKVRDMDFEIVNKLGKIATLELQIKCGNFPHEERCKQLEKSNAAYKAQLTDALKRIERLKTPAVAADCENCKKKVVQSRSAATQIPDSLTRVTGIQSGIIWEDQMLRKLEKERDMMKDICRDRRRRILLMESKLKKYEEMYGALVEENDGVS